MQVITNQKKIKINSRIGQYTSFIALVVLAIGMYISIVYQNLYFYSLLALIVGFILSQVGIYYGNRWGRKPTVDERITSALKGLTKDHSLYHYVSPVAHLLVGPSGIWVIEPYHQRGKIVFEDSRYKQKGGSFLQTYLRIFAQEGIGRPELEIRSDVSEIWKWLKENNIEIGEADNINVALMFSDPNVEIVANDSPYPMVNSDQLKTAIRTNKDHIVSIEVVNQIKQLLPKESVG